MYIKRHIAKCHPNGHMQMDSDLFEMTTWEIIDEIESIRDIPLKLKKYVEFADLCRECSMDSKACTYYSVVLEHAIPDGKPIPELWELAQRAYNGLASLTWCDDELAWERSSGILEKYQEQFEK